MRVSEKVVLLVSLALPVAVAQVAWPAVASWAGGNSGIASTTGPEVAGAAATSAAARTPAPTARPTVGAPATLPVSTGPAPTPGARTAATPADATATAPEAAPPGAAPEAPAPPPTLVPPPRPTGNSPTAAAAQAAPAQAAPPQPALASGNPASTVSTFYQLVGQHQFDTAVQLWSPGMRAAFPPQDNLYGRFAQTQRVTVQRADLVSADGQQATVDVDLVETVRGGGTRHYTGTWRLVRGENGWLLDQPALRTAP